MVVKLFVFNPFGLFQKEKTPWMGPSVWFPWEEWVDLKKSLAALSGFFPWKMLLVRAICCHEKNGLLDQFMEPSTFNKNWQEILQYFSGFIANEIQNAKLVHNKTKSLNYRISFLTELALILQTDSSILRESLLRGRFNKKAFNSLQHSIIVGWDGGFYALLNSISDEEKQIMIEEGDVSKEYTDRWVKEEIEQYSKVVIGKGAFGKVRLCMALTRNETSSRMRPGEVICVKKSLVIDEDTLEYSLAEISSNVWSDYSSGEVSNLIFSPEVYDLMLLQSASSFLIEGHQKGYSMQKFVAVYDGSKIFKKGDKFFNNVEHQFNYIFTLFEVVDKLLSKGVCMTDLKPENTLYDGENGRATLIDLAGVVRKKNAEELKHCKATDISEYTPQYAAPEILDEIEVVDLHKCMSYSLGKIIENVVLKHPPPKILPFHKTLREIADEMVIVEENEEENQIRISVKDALEKMKVLKVSDDKEKTEETLRKFIDNLFKSICQNPKTFGLISNLLDIRKKVIGLMSAPIDPEKHKNIALVDLESTIDFFLKSGENTKENIFVLLGSSGSGKSTLLQLKYLSQLENWKIGDPIPFYINLAVEDCLKTRWNWLVEQFSFKEELKFSLFSGISRRQMILFVDSFDETPVKLNYVSKFFNELGNNSSNKCLICCRSEFVHNHQDFQKYFSSEYSNLQKQFIAPLESTSFNLKQYVFTYYKDSDFGFSNEEIQDLINKIEMQNLKSLMNTSYMVHLTLQVFPNLVKDKEKITRMSIYQKYILIKMLKVSLEVQEMFKERFQFFEEFIFESAEVLARILHRIGGSKVLHSREKTIAKEFFDLLYYNPNLKCLDNNFLAGVIRSLDLNIETRGTSPEEQITIGFNHDSVKNYFLINAITKELRAGQNEILQEKSIVDDSFLIKFIAEVIKDNKELQECLKSLVIRSRKQEGIADDDDKRSVIASANAITILIAANVSFSGCDLQKTRLCGANLSDGMFNGADFSEADLTGVVLENCKLNGALFYKTNLSDIKLGIYPEITQESPILDCCFSSDGNQIVAGCEDGSIKVWDRRKNNKMVMNFGGQSLGALSADGKFIASDGPNNSIKLWELTSGTVIKTFKGHADLVRALEFSLNGKMLLSGSYDKSIKLWDTVTGMLIKTFLGHTDWVRSVAFSPDQKNIVSGSDDKTIRFFDIESGLLIKTLENITGSLASVIFSPDGKSIASCSHDIIIKIWDVTTGQCDKSFDGHLDWVDSITFSVDGSILLSGSRDNSVKIWEVSSGKTIKTFKGHSDWVVTVRFSPNAKHLLSGSRDKTIRIWEIDSGLIVNILQGHKDWIRSAVFSPYGLQILSGSFDKSIRLWDVASGELLKTFEGHSDAVKSIALSPNGKLVVSGSNDKSIKIWDMNSGTLVDTLMGHTGPVNSVVFAFNGKSILSASNDNSLKLWNSSSKLLLKTFNGHSDAVNCVCFLKNGQLVASGSSDEKIILWDVNSGLKIKDLNACASIQSVAFSFDGKFIVSGLDNYTIVLWDMVETIKYFNGHSDSLTKVVISHDSKLILSSSNDKSIKLWDIASGLEIKSFEGHKDSVSSVSFSPDSKLILSASLDKSIKLWEISSPSVLKTFENSKGPILSVCLSPDGKTFISGSEEKNLKFWDLSSGNLIRTLEIFKGPVSAITCSPNGKQVICGIHESFIQILDVETTITNPKKGIFLQGHFQWIRSLTFSPDGHYILSGSDDKSIIAWNPVTAKQIKIFNEHTAPVNSVAFAPGGKYFISGSSDKTLKLWDFDSNKVLKTFEGHTGPVYSVVFSPDGSLFLSGSGDSSIKIWNLTLGKLVKNLHGHSGSVSSLAFSPDGKYFSSGSSDKFINVWEADSGEIIKRLEGHSGSVYSVAYSVDGQFILSRSEDKTIKLWYADLKKLFSKDLIQSNLYQSLDKSLNLYDVGSNSLKKLKGDSDINSILGFSIDNKLIARKSNLKSIKILDIISGNIIKTFECNLEIEKCVFWSDLKLFVFKLHDQSIQFHDLESGKNIYNINDKNSSFPVHLGQNLNPKDSPSFTLYTISANVTSLQCKNMIIAESINLSPNDSQIFRDHHAIIHSA